MLQAKPFCYSKSMHQNQKFMRLAIDAAHAAQQKGGVAIGAVLVHNGTGNVIAAGGSIVGITHDPTSHAEINCIRAACRLLNSDDLYDYTLYSTLEPCHMCLSAAAWARIRLVIFGAYRKDVDETLFDITGAFSDEQEAARMNLRERTHMQCHGGVLEAECAALLGAYHANFKHTR
jgi:tRNA(adenine34) deaminase